MPKFVKNFAEVVNIKNPQFRLFLVSVLVFLLLLPAALLVNFYQNDDWCYYMTVERFAAGNFSLHPYVGPTFYLQGFLGLVFANIFGMVHLPVLTLLMACAAFYVFMLILHEFMNLDLKWSVVVGLLYFLNPLGVYELWGYMTGHYFMAFLFLSLYSFLLYARDKLRLHFFSYVFFTFCGLLIRQVSLVTPLAVSIYYFVERKWKESFVHFVIFASFYYFYSKILPLTPRILEVPLQWHHFAEFDYVFALLYGTFIVLAAYLLPLIVNLFATKEFLREKLQIIMTLVSAPVLYFGLNRFFKPDTISWNEFPYFENVVERTGFYPRGVHGTKYYFAGNYDLWKYWDVGAKVLLVLLLGYLVVQLLFYVYSLITQLRLYRKVTQITLPNFVNLYSIYIFVYMVLMVVTETYYDRYILTAVPLAILFLLSLRPDAKRLTVIGQSLLVGFVVFLGYLSYLFSADFILINRYIWQKSIDVVNEKKIAPALITGTNAWKLTYRNALRNYRYNFSYDSPEVNDKFDEMYRVLEVKEIDFPLNIFVSPKIYLYEIL